MGGARDALANTLIVIKAIALWLKKDLRRGRADFVPFAMLALKALNVLVLRLRTISRGGYDEVGNLPLRESLFYAHSSVTIVDLMESDGGKTRILASFGQDAWSLSSERSAYVDIHPSHQRRHP